MITMARLTRFSCFLAATVLFACLLPQAGHADEIVYRFGVVPQFEHRKLFATWKPIIDEIARRTGIRLELAATLTVPEFERELSAGSYDFVYANPYHILREYTHQGYLPLVRDDNPLRGILVVHRNSPVSSPAELQGQKLAVPSLNAVGASLLLRADLEDLFKVEMIPVNVKTHSSAYLQVASGQLPAAGGVEKTLQEQDARVRELLRVIYTTRDMPSHPIAAHPRVPPRVRQAVQQAIIALDTSPAGRELLAHVPIRRAVTTRMQDYLPMRQWGLDRFWAN